MWLDKRQGKSAVSWLLHSVGISAFIPGMGKDAEDHVQYK